MPRLERPRPLEERFGDHRKKLGGIGRAVLVDQRRESRVGCVAEGVELRAHDSPPGEIIGVGLEVRSAVAALILEIELVGEFVEHQVLAVGR